MNPLKIKETCLYVHDLEAAKRFYNEVPGFSIISYVKRKAHFFSCRQFSSIVF